MDNLDQTEVDKFSALAASWWEQDGSSRALHDINPCRLAYVAARAELRGTAILDIGCGGGLLSEALARAGGQVTGIDASAELVRVASRHAFDAGVTLDYVATTAEAYAALRPAGFAVITCMELLEHVPEPASLLHACRDLLQPGGSLFLSTINRTAKAYVTTILGAEYLTGLLPRGTHDYARFIRPAELAAWLREAGFEVVDIQGMRYHPLLRRATLVRDPGVNYLLHAVLPR